MKLSLIATLLSLASVTDAARLPFAGSVGRYHGSNGMGLDRVMQIRGGMQLFVKTLTGKTVSIEVDYCH